MEEDNYTLTNIARALKNLGVTHIFASISESEFTKVLLQQGIRVIHCFSSCTAAYAADANARIKGFGVYVESAESIDSLSCLRASFRNGIPVVCLLEENQEDVIVNQLFDRFTCFQGYVANSKDANEGINDAISAAVESSSPVFLRVCNGALNENKDTALTRSITPVLKKKRIAACERNHSSSNRDVIDLVLACLKECFSSGEIIVISEIPCLNTEFPPACIFEFGRDKEPVGWSVGATIGYSLAAEDKRLITCITDLSFQSMAAEISTMLKMGCNAIIILLNTSHSNLVHWDCPAIVDAMDEGKLKSWSSRVYTEQRLRKAIRMANLLQKNKLCLIEVLIDNAISTENLSFENYRVLFCEGSQEINKDLGKDECFCVICQANIINKEYVVSYPNICSDVFHKVCLDEMFSKGYNQCPCDRRHLHGPCDTWMFENDEVPDDVIPDVEVPPKPVLTISGQPSIESSCRRCSVRYPVGAFKVTLFMCSHTYCWSCFHDLGGSCHVCAGPTDPSDFDVVSEEDLEVVVSEEDLEVVPLAPGLAVAAEGLEENEVNIEAAEVPIWDEEEAHRLAVLGMRSMSGFGGSLNRRG